MSAQGNEDTGKRLAKLEAWVEVVMRRLATLGGLEPLLIELDQARGADYETGRTEGVSVDRTPVRT